MNQAILKSAVLIVTQIEGYSYLGDGKCGKVGIVTGEMGFATYNLKGYCTKCGDGVCWKPENPCNCPQDCKEVNQTCYESDYGKYYYNKGSVKILTGSNAGFEINDTCINSTTLNEIYCEGGFYFAGPYPCPNGCKDGACVSEAKKCPIHQFVDITGVRKTNALFAVDYFTMQDNDEFEVTLNRAESILEKCDIISKTCSKPAQGYNKCSIATNCEYPESQGTYIAEVWDKKCGAHDKYKFVVGPKYISLRTEKQSYKLNEQVKILSSYVDEDMDINKLFVEVENPYGKRKTIELNLECLKEEIPNLPMPETRCIYIGYYYDTNTVGKYNIEGIETENMRIFGTYFKIFDYEKLKRYLILKDIGDYKFERADISETTAGGKNIIIYGAIYRRNNKGFTAGVVEFDSREDMNDFIEKEIKKMNHVVEKIGNYYVYRIEYYRQIMYLWTRKNFMIFIFPDQPVRVISASVGSTSIETTINPARSASAAVANIETKASAMLIGEEKTEVETLGEEIIEPLELLMTYLDKYPSELISIGSECEEKGGYCITTNAKCKEDYEESKYVCLKKEDKCCIKEIDTDDFFNIIFKLETLRVSMDKMKKTSLELSNYYDSVGDSDRAAKFREVANMFEGAKNKIDNIISKIRINLNEPEYLREQIKNDINELKAHIRSILLKLLS